MTRPMTLMRYAVAAMIVCGSLVASAERAGAQGVRPGATGSIIGFVSDSLGAPIAGADIMVAGAPATHSDSVGNFIVRLVPSGRALILIRKLGFLPEAVVTRVPPGGTASAPVVMAPMTRTLSTVRVSAQRDTLATPDYHGVHKFDLFYQHRRTSLGGIFFTRSQIEERMPAKLSDLLEGRPARLPQCQAALLQGGASASDYQLFIDDMPYRLAPGETAREALDAIPWTWVEGIEIYTGPSELPVEAVGNACAAIFVWMRSTPADSSG